MADPANSRPPPPALYARLLERLAVDVAHDAGIKTIHLILNEADAVIGPPRAQARAFAKALGYEWCWRTDVSPRCRGLQSRRSSQPPKPRHGRSTPILVPRALSTTLPTGSTTSSACLTIPSVSHAAPRRTSFGDGVLAHSFSSRGAASRSLRPGRNRRSAAGERPAHGQERERVGDAEIDMVLANCG